MSPENTKAEPLLALLNYIETDVASAKQYSVKGDDDMVEKVGVTALECLASIGKGMQVPEDVPIDIYDDSVEGTSGADNYWESGQGRAVQQRIVACFSVLEVAGTSSAAIDAVRFPAYRC